MEMLVLLIPLLPLAAFLLNVAFFRNNRPIAAGLSISAVAGSFLLSFWAFLGLDPEAGPKVIEFTWLSVTSTVFGNFSISVGVLIDALVILMLFVVTLVALMVNIYSWGYMSEDKSLPKFFSFLSLFTFSMLGLVVSPNLFQMYIFWELVGLCSYLLIGYYYTTNAAASAGKKAFIVNRIGDFGMFVGILLLTCYLGGVDFIFLKENIAAWPLLAPDWLPLGVVALLLFCGAVGKSAQFPLHVWLPDAMEGPTPVSALIHAATMVAAGVYLVARTFFVFDAALLSSVDAIQVVGLIGAVTALMAATIACVQFDIKRVLAYSTLSQLGYMMMAFGAGAAGVGAGMFHLYTHAFFKALLFLGAGAVIHSVHTNDIRQMGQLLKKMPVTGWTFLVACLSIAGLPPFSGFFSKDEILFTLKNSDQMFLYWTAMLVSVFTAFYMFRLFYYAFWGKSPEELKVHDVGWSMKIPLIFLAVLSLSSAWIALPQKGFGHYIHYERAVNFENQWQQAQALAKVNPEIKGNLKAINLWKAQIKTWPSEIKASTDRSFHWHSEIWVPAVLAAFAGIFLGLVIYVWRLWSVESITGRLGFLYRLVYNKYYVDEIYMWLISKVYFRVSKIILWFDRKVVDAFMNGLAWAAQSSGGLLKLLQSGQVQFYALIFLAGILTLIAAVKMTLFN
jgi:NADH-quinone oxidoreductase subunit L